MNNLIFIIFEDTCSKQCHSKKYNVLCLTESFLQQKVDNSKISDPENERDTEESYRNLIDSVHKADTFNSLTEQ